MLNDFTGLSLGFGLGFISPAEHGDILDPAAANPDAREGDLQS
jgi:hypothetical protein